MQSGVIAQIYQQNVVQSNQHYLSQYKHIGRPSCYYYVCLHKTCRRNRIVSSNSSNCHGLSMIFSLPRFAKKIDSLHSVSGLLASLGTSCICRSDYIAWRYCEKWFHLIWSALFVGSTIDFDRFRKVWRTLLNLLLVH